MAISINFTPSEFQLILTLSRRVRELRSSGSWMQPDDLDLLVKGFDQLELDAKEALWLSVAANLGDSAGR